MQFPNESWCHTKLLQHLNVICKRHKQGPRKKNNPIGDARSLQNKFDGSLSAALYPSWHANIHVHTEFTWRLTVSKIEDFGKVLGEINLRSGLSPRELQDRITNKPLLKRVLLTVEIPYLDTSFSPLRNGSHSNLHWYSFNKQFQFTKKNYDLTRCIALPYSLWRKESAIATPRLQLSENEWPTTWLFTAGTCPVYPGIGPSLGSLTFEWSVGDVIAYPLSKVLCLRAEFGSRCQFRLTKHTANYAALFPQFLVRKVFLKFVKRMHSHQTSTC